MSRFRDISTRDCEEAREAGEDPRERIRLIERERERERGEWRNGASPKNKKPRPVTIGPANNRFRAAPWSQICRDKAIQRMSDGYHALSLSLSLILSIPISRASRPRYRRGSNV